MNYQQIEQELAVMTERSRLYILVKNELEKRGHWKAAPRGKSFNRGEDSRRTDLQRQSTRADIREPEYVDVNDWSA